MCTAAHGTGRIDMETGGYPIMGRGDRRVLDMRPRQTVSMLRAGGSAVFSGTAYAPNGHPTTELNEDSSKPWVKFSKQTFAFTEEIGPPSDPFPADEYWFRKAGVSGDIRMFM